MEHVEGIIAEIFSGLIGLIGAVSAYLYLSKGGKDDKKGGK